VIYSGLVLADGIPLTLADIITDLDLSNLRLVTLSACETGFTETNQSPDEYLGLPSGFIHAGAPAVVSTLWAVNDLSTMLLMEQFYAHYLSGSPTAQALRQAQLWLRSITAGELAARFVVERKKPSSERIMTYEQASIAWRRFVAMNTNEHPFSHPYYWAAFTFSGA